MTTLALDTSTARLVVGLVDGISDAARPAPVVRAARVLDDARRHNELLVPTIAEVLAEAGLTYADIDRVVCGCGPGPFTGLRVGMATAAATADALGVPLRGVCSLDAVARSPRLSGRVALVVSDARRREAYWATYDAAGARTAGPEVCAPADLPVPEGLAVVSAPEMLAEKLPETGDAELVELYPEPVGLVTAPEVEFRPIYLRRPDAVAPTVHVSPALRP